jgi:lysylphosphatidylglycerol synthetase-like protein (DUF2156 family)
MARPDSEEALQGEVFAVDGLVFGRLLPPGEARPDFSWVAGWEPWLKLDPWPEHERSLNTVLRLVRRAARKGVSVVWFNCEGMAPVERVGTPLKALIARWRDSKALPPMSFAVESRWEQTAERALVGLAWRDRELVGAALALPRRPDQWSIVHLVRASDSPQGTVEMLVLSCVHRLRDCGAKWATLGLMLLVGPVPGLLEALRPFFRYGFDLGGLVRFKLKFRPHRLVPLLVEHRGLSWSAALYRLLKAFSGGSLSKFALAWARRLFSPDIVADKGHCLMRPGLSVERSRL